MNIGNQISAIRKEHQLTQEKFGELFHVTRQTVSNWKMKFPKVKATTSIPRGLLLNRYSRRAG